MADLALSLRIWRLIPCLPLQLPGRQERSHLGPRSTVKTYFEPMKITMKAVDLRMMLEIKSPM